MSQAPERHPVTRKAVVYHLPGAERVRVVQDHVFHTSETGPLTMDLYYPPAAGREQPLPAVVFVVGFSDVGAERVLGCKAKEMESYRSWARLVAASGLIGITYTNRDPTADAETLLRTLSETGASLGIDVPRIGLWACSGHVPLALWLLMQARSGLTGVKCAALSYGFTIDLDGNTDVAEAARAWGFATPAAGRGVEDLPADVPLLVVRCGRDQFPGLNAALDRFVGQALRRNLPLTIVNHHTAPHAFDVEDDSDTSREIVRMTLAFLRSRLR